MKLKWVNDYFLTDNKMNIKGIFILFFIGLLTFSCQKEKAKKPKKFIEEETMISIIYDLSVLEAIKSNNPVILEQHQINPYTYIYKKYKIDSLQFVENNLYYAADLKNYKKMYEKVELQLGEQKKIADSAMAVAKRPIPSTKMVIDSTKNKRKNTFLKKQ